MFGKALDELPKRDAQRLRIPEINPVERDVIGVDQLDCVRHADQPLPPLILVVRAGIDVGHFRKRLLA